MFGNVYVFFDIDRMKTTDNTNQCVNYTNTKRIANGQTDGRALNRGCVEWSTPSANTQIHKHTDTFVLASHIRCTYT